MAKDNSGCKRPSTDYGLDFFKNHKRAKPEQLSSKPNDCPDRNHLVPISKLNARKHYEKPQESIEFRVTFKGSLKKSLSGMDIFSFDGFDGCAEIGISAFRDMALDLHSKIELHKTYLLENFTVKFAEPRFNRSSTCDLQVCIEDRATKLYASDTVFPDMDIKFTPIEDILEASDKEHFDCAGIIVAENLLATGPTYSRREFAMVDKSKCTIWVTLWDDNSRMPIKLYDTVIIRRAEVRSKSNFDFDTKKTHVVKTLTVNSQHGALWLNPETPGMMDLKSWFETNKPNAADEDQEE